MRSLENKPHLGAFPEAKKSFVFVFFFVLGLSEKISYCAKAQRKRDMCNP